MAAGLRAGIGSKLYRNTGTFGTPVWNEITAAMDVELGLEMGTAEIKARLSNFVQNLTTLVQAPVTFGMIADTSIDDYNALRDAQLNRTIVPLAVADDAIATAGTQHWRGDYYIAGFPVSQPLEEGNRVNVTCALAYSANVPLWTTVP